MKNNILYYSVGALIYSPGNRLNIHETVINERLGKKYSLALCLEDTINDNFLLEAEGILIESIKKIYNSINIKDFYLPKIFIRVRNPKQILSLTKALKNEIDIICGFIIPKFSIDNANDYIEEIIKANEISKKKLYIMPIYENNSIINLNTRYEILYSLKDSLSKIEELVLNIRVGGNDLCNAFSIRRNSFESIHEIKPISSIFSDIITVYGMDYIISGPVWEYYNGNNWKDGLIKELNDDRLCGFIGKTVIHPNQISVVNEAYKVSKYDYEDARSILNWNINTSSLVMANHKKERMNEYKIHGNWARQILFLAEYFGVSD